MKQRSGGVGLLWIFLLTLGCQVRPEAKGSPPSSLPVTSAPTTQKDATPSPSLTGEVVGTRKSSGESELSRPRILVVIRKEGFLLFFEEKIQAQLPPEGKAYPYQALSAQLSVLQERVRDPSDELVVAVETVIPYEIAIKTIDIIVQSGFPSVKLIAAEALTIPD